MENEQKDIKKSFWHNVKRMFGGEYYESKTCTTYYYRSEILIWFEVKWFNLKTYFTIKYYTFMVWFVKKIISKI